MRKDVRVIATPPVGNAKNSGAKPFLLVVCRPGGAIAVDERKTIVERGGLDPRRDVVDVSLLDPGAPHPAEMDFADYSGVFITGSPFGFGESDKSPEHRRMEERVLSLAGRLVDEDVPTLALCFGMQAVAIALGGSLIDGFGEDLQAPVITLTDEAAHDAVASRLPPTFRAYVGHSESVGTPPGDAVLLATGDFCRTQMVRWGRNVYGTQFHPEITTPGMLIRIDAYGDAYYPAHEKAAVIARCDAADVEGGNRIITEFVRRYRS